MIQSFLSLPTFLMCLITIIISTGISLTALFLIRKRVSWEKFKDNHEVGGFLYNAIGLIYAVLIAFVVFAAWEDFNAAKEYCDKEADLLQNLYLNSEGLPVEIEPLIKQNIVDYLTMVVNGDWPLLSKDEANPESKQKLVDIWHIYDRQVNPKDDKEKIYFSEALDKLNSITEYRRMRILSAQNHIPVIIWTVILIGAMSSVGFTLFFGTKSHLVQAIMTALFAMTNAIVILMILALDHPYTGDIKISSEAFQYVLDFIQTHH